jgi:cytochrome c oxidase subunit 2
MIQSTAALISLVLSLVVVAVALLVARRAKSRDAGGYAAVYRVRRYYAVALVAGLAVVLFLTLPRIPYASAVDEAPTRTIDAIGWMWAWDFKVEGESVGPRVELTARELVEFAVTSKDVNHGFGIYDTQGRLIAQTQAMPGYVNRLRVRFPEPGTYYVLCLEYCGLGHTAMMAEVSVR